MKLALPLFFGLFVVGFASACSGAGGTAVASEDAAPPGADASEDGAAVPSEPVSDGGADASADVRTDVARDALPDSEPLQSCAWKRIAGSASVEANGGALVFSSAAAPKYTVLARLGLESAFTGPIEVAAHVRSVDLTDNAMFMMSLECGPQTGVGVVFYRAGATMKTGFGIDGDTELFDLDPVGIDYRVRIDGSNATATLSRNGSVVETKTSVTAASTTECKLLLFASSGSAGPYRVEVDHVVVTGIGGCADDFSKPATY